MPNVAKIPASFEDGRPVQRKVSQLGWRTGISGNQALMNFFRVLVGTGVLALPLAFKQSGPITGIILILVAGYFFTYLSCDKLVVSALALAQRHGYTSLDYGNVAEQSFNHSFESIRRFGPIFRYFANTSIGLMQQGAAAVYTVFIKEHLEEIWSRLFPEDHRSGTTFFLVTLLLLLLLVMIRNIKLITGVSTVGNLLMSLALIIVFQDLVRPPYADQKTSNEGDWNLLSIVSASGNIAYAFGVQAVVLPLANKMMDPTEMSGWRGVLSLGCSVVTILYALVGFFGYLKYGDAVRGSVTLNLPDTTFYFLLRVLLVLVVMATYLIQHFIMIDITWTWMKNRFPKNHLISRYPGFSERLLCALLVIILLAILVPNLGRITSLVGATGGCLLGLIIPACMHTATFLPEYLRESNYKAMLLHMSTNILFIFCGSLFMITAFYSNL